MNHRKTLASAAAQRMDFSMGWSENQPFAARQIMEFLLLSPVQSFDSTNTKHAYLREYGEQIRSGN
jgi:hypothetical protein